MLCQTAYIQKHSNNSECLQNVLHNAIALKLALVQLAASLLVHLIQGNYCLFDIYNSLPTTKHLYKIKFVQII